MEAPVDFGREAIEKEQRNILKRKKMKTTIVKAVLLLAVASTAVLFRGDIKDLFASSPGKGKSKVTGQVASSAGVTVLKKWDLPKELNEISGLVYLDNERFACIQDEAGTIYIYNTGTASIEKEIPFAGAGDFEGLTLVGTNAWVVRSDGHLFEVSDFQNNPSVKEYKTQLSIAHNVEGLCYDQKNNRLLLAIKDAEPKSDDYKGIYAFDLATRSMPEQPAFKIDLNHAIYKNIGDSKKKKGGTLMPSAIAIHPITGDMYITDGRKSKLLLLKADGSVKKLLQLNNSDFAQPEGITFTPAGELFISNEGPKQPANILNVAIKTE